MKVLVSGLINIESNVFVNNFPVEYSPIEYAFNQVSFDFSGVAYNIIKALSALGDKTIPVSIIGKDNIANLILAELKRSKIPCDFIFQDLKTTCSSVILFDSQGKRKIYCDLKNIQDFVIPLEKIEESLKSIDGLILCNINFNDNLIKNAKKFNKPIFTDVQDLSNIFDDYNKRFLKNSDVVFLSDEKIQGNHEEFLISIYKEYKNKIIVLGQGKTGALMLDSSENKIYSIKSVYTRPVVNTVGAGDSLFSAFVHFYLKNLSPVECLKNAVTFASYKIGESGGAKGFLTEPELKKTVKNLDFKIFTVRDKL